ncbi:MAG: FGGY-family carbohydrate kinase [Deinococcota bacterium]
MADLLLGIDVGTYSSKGVLTTAEGEILGQHVVKHDMEIPQPGWAEQDADAVWWHDVVEICKTLLSGEYSGMDVAALAVSAIGPCLLPLDASGKPLRKGILYGVDARAEEEIGILNNQLGEETVYNFSKMAFTSQAIGPKILWLQRHEPEVWQRTKTLTTASSYLIFKLTGEHVIDRHTASHYMPLIDMETLEWSERFTDRLAPLDMLPKLGWSDELAGTVSPAAAELTGLKIGTPVTVGAVDALAEAISVGMTQPGDLMIMYGSTTFFILVLDAPKPDKSVWTTAGAFYKQYALAAGMATTGSLTRWLRDEFARDLPEAQAYSQLFDAAVNIAPGAEGLLMLPYFSGERTPINDAKARGVIAGLTLSHTREHIFRAALESVAYGIRHNLETFQQLGAPIRRVAAVGGGVRDNLWPQIVSDVSGMNQLIPKRSVGASYGNAFLAGLGIGQLKRSDLTNWAVYDHEVSPQADSREIYDNHYELYLELYQGSRATVHQLVTHTRSRN